MENKASLTVEPGDATNPRYNEGNIVLIPHICNDIGGWGAGFVLAITKRFGYIPMAEYKNGIETKGLEQDSTIDSSYPLKLGSVQFVLVNEIPMTYIVNMIAQEGTSPDVNGYPPIRYSALTKAMESVVFIGRELAIKKETDIEIHCPKFGCGLAGSKWEVIEELIKNIWVRRAIDVTVYEYE